MTLEGLTTDASEFDLATVDRLLTTTRSVRLRLDLTRPVDLRLIDECLSLALQAPNGSGAELWRFIVVTDPTIRRGIGQLYRAASETYLQYLRDHDPDLDETSPTMRSSKQLWDRLTDVPVHVVPCLEREPWHRSSPLRSYADASVYASIYPATWSFQLACRSRGLGTCFVTSILKYEEELRALINAPQSFAIGGLLAVAHSTGTFKPAIRKPLAEVRRLNHWLPN